MEYDVYLAGRIDLQRMSDTYTYKAYAVSTELKN